MNKRESLDLYQHDASTMALLLSRDGNRAHAQWVPRSLLEEPKATKLMRPKLGGEPVEYGTFAIETWKLEELEWLGDEPDERQMGLSL